MTTTINKVLRRVEIVQDANGKNAEVEWENQVLQDGSVINKWPHRIGYQQAQKAQFLSDVEGASSYLSALGW